MTTLRFGWSTAWRDPSTQPDLILLILEKRPEMAEAVSLEPGVR
jgi:hypothetical protein